MCRVVATHHACQRAVERFRVEPRRAAAFVCRCRRDSIKLPMRHACGLLGCRRPRQKNGISYRVSGETLLVCRGGRVITLWRLSPGQLATVLLWAATGLWLP